MSTRSFPGFHAAGGGANGAALAADPLTLARAALEAASHPEAALPQIAAGLAGGLADICAIYLADAQGRLSAAARAASVCAACPSLDGAVLAAAAALQSRQAILISPDDPAGSELARAARADGLALRSVMLAPLAARGRPLGVLALLAVAPGRPAGPAELEIAANLAFCLGLALDQGRLVGEQRMAGEFLRHHAQTLEAIIQSVPSAIGLYDSSADYRCLRHNPAFRALVGPADAGADPADQLAGLPLAALFDDAELPAIRALFDQAMASGLAVSAELERGAADGTVRTYAWTLRPLRANQGGLLGILAATTDITAQRRADAERVNFERKLLAAQKLESLGMLASGIAHDLNNILTIAKGNVELAMMDLETGSEQLLAKYLATADVATQRATDLARQILAYANKQPAAAHSAQINEIVSEMDELLQVPIGKQIALRYELCPDVPAVAVNVTQIRQVLMNLIINASEAIGASRGVISLRTGLLDAAEPWLRGAYPGAAGSFVFAEVADSGCGMDAATRAAIFEPFFTTKPTGCGLGLAAAQGIIQAHGGMIWVDSALGRGTTFRILLPCTGAAWTAANRPCDGDAWRGGGTILLIDDEQSVRQTVGRMLEKLGFDVVFAASGLEGLRALAAAPELIKLVVMDMTMAGLNGLETLALIRKRAPALPVLLMSGSLLPGAPGAPAAAPGLRFLQKPLSFADLRAVLPELLPED